jgi:AraC-like DNA-binding protein
LGFIVSRYQLSGIETKLSLLHEGFPNDMPSSKAMILGFYLHFTVYGICALVMLSRTREELYRYTSQAIGPNIGFFKFLIYDFIVVWGINMISMYVWFGEVGSTLLQAGTVLNIFFIANAIVYGGLKFPHIFGIEDAGRQKYEKNLLSEAEKEHYGRKLLEFMETRKPYLEPTLSLSDLATQLAVPSHVLSQILNVVYQQNFYDFINSYRIEESKRLLCVPHSNGKTILEILYQCGFNSKSVFNAAFKKFTGMTPREFKRSSSSPSSQTVIPASFQ